VTNKYCCRSLERTDVIGKAVVVDHVDGACLSRGGDVDPYERIVESKGLP